MLRVGLTGGLASGKSFVGHVLADLGCLLIRADDLGREAQAPGGEAYDDIVREFGREILTEDGSIDRRRLAAVVFHDPERLKKLNALVHPHVAARRHKLEEEFARVQPHGIAVTEAAILIETGSYRQFDRLIVAACPPDLQVARAMERDRLTREEVLDRMSRQMPLDEKVKVADYVIDTSGPREETVAKTLAVYALLRSLNL
jgi:dephospho-CoA kinase